MARFICIGEESIKISNLCNLTAVKRDKVLLKIYQLVNNNDHRSTRCEACGTKSYGSLHCILCRQKLWKTRNPVIIRKNLHDLQNGLCCYCGEHIELGKSTIEHIEPKSKNGQDSFYNYALSCHPCNVRRGNDDFEPFMKAPCSHKVEFGEPVFPLMTTVTKNTAKPEQTPDDVIKKLQENLASTQVAIKKYQRKSLAEHEVLDLLNKNSLVADDVLATNLSKYTKRQRKAIMALQQHRGYTKNLGRLVSHSNRIASILLNKYGVETP